jgi:hypothetical protein
MRFMYQGISDTDFDKYTEDAVVLFGKAGLNTAFENLEGFPEDWKTNPVAFVKFVRDHKCHSFWSTRSTRSSRATRWRRP